MSRFPKLTETFVLDEMLAMQSQGVTVEVFPLWRESARLMHADASALVSRAHFLPTLNSTILAANLFWLRTRPRIYLSTLFVLVRANRRSMRFLLGALAVFPKACCFARKMQALEVDHVHAHFASHPAAAAYVIGKLAELPWSFTAHGSDLHREQAMLSEKVKAANFAVAISEYNRRFIVERVGTGFEHKVRKLHCGVERNRFTHAETGASRLRTNEAPGIVCIGTLHAVKGQRFLLLACGRLRSLGHRFRCHLIGDGEDRQALESLAVELGIADDVVFHGAIERERVREVLSSMQIAAAPSVPTADGRREGIPVAL
ncbi:MAG: glycosyltransferase, partial [Pseudomonadota bacterium]